MSEHKNKPFGGFKSIWVISFLTLTVIGLILLLMGSVLLTLGGAGGVFSELSADWVAGVILAFFSIIAVLSLFVSGVVSYFKSIGHRSNADGPLQNTANINIKVAEPTVKSKWWYVYFNLLLFMFIISIALIIFPLNQPILSKSKSDLVIMGCLNLISLVSLIGLWGYIRNKVFFNQRFWQVFFYVSIFLFIFVPTYQVIIVNLAPIEAILLFGGVMLQGLLSAPLYIALWRYSFVHVDVWQTIDKV